VIPDPEVIASIVQSAIKAQSDSTPRTIQSREGLIGPSDLGFCREKARLMMSGTKQSDTKPTWAADVGTAIHAWAGQALATAFPGWLCEGYGAHPGRVTATFPNGAEVSGTPDIIVPDWNAVLDIKTVDGFERIKRYGTSEAHQFQRHTYALGCIAAGILDPDRPMFVGNVYLDRSGEEWMPYVTSDPFDPLLTMGISEWIDDVIYAVTNRESASRDIAAPVCEKICEYFTVCRGGLPVADNVLIEDEGLLTAIEMYVEGRDLENAGKRMKSQAATELSGISGTSRDWQVRWTTVGESDVPGYTRKSYEKIDVRKVRRG
jgi:hypothetical protein